MKNGTTEKYLIGLTADGRGLTNFMRTESLNHEVSFMVFRRNLFLNLYLDCLWY